MNKRHKLTGIFSTDIVVLNDTEKKLLQNFFDTLSEEDDSSMFDIEKKLMDLERMSTAISRFPSIHETSILAGEKRNQQTLIKNLCRTHPDARLLSMPTKAILGRGFLVAKFHIFSALSKIEERASIPESEFEALRKATLNIMFTIMAEDVYISILDSNLLETEERKKVADALIFLWEHRLDQNTTSFAPVLTRVWTARDKLAPVFGTMMGTSELFLLSSELGESWSRFTVDKLSNEVVGQALEEFLFGISYEDIIFVREELKRQGQSSISKDQVAVILNRNIEFKNTDPKSFYTSYVTRRDNANARKRLNIKGPKNTLEDYYISFLFEHNLKLKDQKQKEHNKRSSLNNKVDEIDLNSMFY